MGGGLRSFLEGVRVVDLSRHLPGPLATLLLADMGAEIIKVEPPEGDEMRGVGALGPTGRSLSFDALNANKTSRRIDLKSEAGKEELLRLTDSADIVVESFRPGVLNRLGVGFQTMRARNPRLICCAMSGFGQAGAMAQVPAHDINYLGLAGLLAYSGSQAGPAIPTPPLADVTASFIGTAAILGALHKRGKDGFGYEIDLGVADCAMLPQIMQLADLQSTGSPVRGAAFNTGGTAYYNVYSTSDGAMVALGAIEPRFWTNFCRAAGREDWVARHADAIPQTALIEEASAFFAAMTAAEANERFVSAECCFTPVLDLEAATRTPHVSGRRLVVDGPDGIPQALFPVHVDGQPPAPRMPFVDSDGTRPKAG